MGEGAELKALKITSELLIIFRAICEAVSLARYGSADKLSFRRKGLVQFCICQLRITNDLHVVVAEKLYFGFEKCRVNRKQ